MSWPLIVSADVGSRFGVGHLKRCLTVALAARDAGAAIAFDLHEDPDLGRGLVESSGLDWRVVGAENPCSRGSVVLVDRVHAASLECPALLLTAIARWCEAGMRVALVDDAGERSLHRRHPDLHVDLLIRPYAGEQARSDRDLAGPSYAPLAPEYAKVPSRTVRQAADRVLISCGGTDPRGITARIVAALATIQDRRLEVRTILGPGFAPSYCFSLKDIARDTKHYFEWCGPQPSLLESMLWCDVALATSGVTKYELAATGTPAILLSPDSQHHAANVPFSTIGSSVDLGLADIATPDTIASALRSLLDQPDRRAAMSRAGRNAVDGQGAARIAARLKDLVDAQ